MSAQREQKEASLCKKGDSEGENAKVQRKENIRRLKIRLVAMMLR